MLYVYASNLLGLPQHLLTNHVKMSPISYPGYTPSGEINLADPDGYLVAVCHWGKAERNLL